MSQSWLEYLLERPKAVVINKIKKTTIGWDYLVYFLGSDVDDTLFNEDNLKATGEYINPNKFQQYEIVKIVDPYKEKENFKCLSGFIGGIALDVSGRWHYIIQFFQKKYDSCYFEEHELESTKQFVKKEDYYSAESIKVIVHPDGRGELKEE